MRTRRLIQELIEELSNSFNLTMIVLDKSLDVLAYSGTDRDFAERVAKDWSNGNKEGLRRFCIKIVSEEHSCDTKFVLFIENDKNAEVMAEIIGCKLAKTAGILEYDRSLENIFRDIINGKDADLNNLIKSRFLDNKAERVLVLIRVAKCFTKASFDVIRQSFALRDGETAVLMSFNTIAVIKYVDSENPDELVNMAKLYISKAKGLAPQVGIGGVIDELSKLRASYRGAEIAIAALGLCLDDIRVQCYNRLGIKHLILGMSENEKQRYISEFVDLIKEKRINEQELNVLETYISMSFNIAGAAQRCGVSAGYVRALIKKYSDAIGAKLNDFYVAAQIKLIILMIRAEGLPEYESLRDILVS